jgi:chromosome segregation ATPase
LYGLIRVKWNDSVSWLDRQVPVETQIKELRLQADKIDDDIKPNIGKLAKLEVDVNNLEQNVAALKEDQSRRRGEIAALAKKLEDRQSNVAANDCRSEAAQLESLVNSYEVKNEKVRSLEGILVAKRQTVEAAHEKIRAMKAQRDALVISIQKLETRKELVEIKSQQCQIGVSNDTINQCNALVKKIDEQLRVQEKTGDLYGRYGYSDAPATAEKGAKDLKDVLKKAKQSLKVEGADQ